MSKDIRSFFISSKQSSQSSVAKEVKPRKKAAAIITSDDDEVQVSPSKQNKAKATNEKKSNSNNIKSRSKKRAIVSSDEDESEVLNHVKNKKPKVLDNKNSDHVEEKPIEIIEDPAKLFGNKPVKRINAVKVPKKSSKPTVNEPMSNKQNDFIDDDDFDATLNQLDTSQIEDKYLSSISNEKSSSFFKSNKKDVSNSEKKEKHKHENSKEKNEKDVTDSKNKDKHVSPVKSKEKSTNETSPSNKNKHKEKTDLEPKPIKDKHSNTKSDNNKEKKKKTSSSAKLEIEKDDKPHKNSTKAKNADYNDIIEEKVEKKKHNAILYHNYLNRGGARNPGSKEIPKGAEQCFNNLTFLITGVLDSLERQEAEDIIKEYGGKILHSVSKKLNYIIVGDEAGPSKLAKAENLGINRISEDGFLELLRTRPSGVKSQASDSSNKRKRNNSTSTDHKSSDQIKRNKEDSSPKDKSNKDISEKINKNKIDTSPKDVSSPKQIKIEKDSHTSSENAKSNLSSPLEIKPSVSKISEPNASKTKIKETTASKPEIKPSVSKVSESSASKTEIKETTASKPLNNNVAHAVNDGVDHITALVEKYRPKELKQIIGQTGEKSNARKLQYWLTNWHKNHGKDSKAAKPKYNARDDTGTIYKAALLSGPPGIGKTTTAYVTCAQLGYEVLEFNASDTRSKKLLQEEIAGILSNKTVRSFLTSGSDKKHTSPKHVLLMDEVDGMAGNEDRGGMQELIAFIKSTEVPIICICNDRNSPKIRTLSNYTFDLRFQKPRLEQIRAAMMSMCFKEGIKVSPEELTLIIQSTNQDIRQVINHLAVLSAKSQTATESKEKTKYKNLRLGPWDVVRKVFTAEEHKNMSIHDKSDLFFHDYNIAPLFVEENYPIVTPAGPRAEHLKKLADCSDSLAIGDTIEKIIRGNQSWSLLPVQACFSSVIPGSVMSGYINSQINFPSWLGRNSKRNKCDRLLQDITVHARITTGASKEAINLDYLKILVDSIVRPLAVEGTEGVNKAIEIMNQYHLTREDLDSLIELTKWPHTRDPMQSVDTKTKTAFTRAYNKTALFSSTGTMKKKASRDTQDEDFVASDEELSDNNEDEDKIENDKLIKAKTSKAKSGPSESKEKPKKAAKSSTSRSKMK